MQRKCQTYSDGDKTPVVTCTNTGYRRTQYNFSHLDSTSDRGKRLRRQVLNKLGGEVFKEKLDKVLAERCQSRSDLDKMSLTELRVLWRTVHRRWHSSYRCQQTKIENAEKRRALAYQAIVDGKASH